MHANQMTSKFPMRHANLVHTQAIVGFDSPLLISIVLSKKLLMVKQSTVFKKLN